VRSFFSEERASHAQALRGHLAYRSEALKEALAETGILLW
jgi:hypothetical protein